MEVTVLGGGYAGVAVTRRLGRTLSDDVEVTLVDEDGTHLVQHELHRLVRRPTLRSAIEFELAALVPDATIREATVIKVDAEEPCVALDDGDTLMPDVLVVCLGALTATYGLPGIREHGIPLKRIAHAEAIHERIKGFSKSDRIVIGGAGLSGVQVAGELAAIHGGPRVTIIEQQATVAPGFPAPFRDAVADALVEIGVEILTNATIERATDEEIVFADGSVTPYDAFVWTGGISGSPALDGARPTVRADLRWADRTFAIGDAARVIDDGGQRVPAAAQTAVRQAPVAAVNVSRIVEAERNGQFVFDPRMQRYRYNSPGWAVSVGDDAVASVGNRVVTGRSAIALKATIEAGYLGSLGRVSDALDVMRSEVLRR